MSTSFIHALNVLSASVNGISITPDRDVLQKSDLTPINHVCIVLIFYFRAVASRRIYTIHVRELFYFRKSDKVLRFVQYFGALQ